MTDAATPARVPLPDDEIYLLDEPTLTPDTCRRLIEFNEDYQQRVLAAFLKLKYDWEAAHPGQRIPGLCANYNTITGEMRPDSEQRAWTWGDGRGLGLWAYFLMKGRIADDERAIPLASGGDRDVNMRDEYEAYCDHIYESLVDRYEACGGSFPKMADIDTNRPSDDPRNVVAGPGQASSSDVFCLTAMYQYGMLRRNDRAMEIGEALMEKCTHAARTGSYPGNGRKTGHRSQGSPMVTVGALVDILKGIVCLEGQGVERYSPLKATLISNAREMVDYVLSYHYDPETGAFWEENGPDGEPWINEKGQQVCDPGHTAEACGFFAELCSFLPEEGDGPWEWSRSAILGAVQQMIDLVTDHGFSPKGVMFKNIDLKTKEGVPDTSGGGAAHNRATAPWWNIREHCAACLKIYQLTGHEHCLDGYKKSQNASYLHYPNARLGGLMVQTLDPFTLEPLDIHPATGNVDPMHSPRAREREIEALELILPTL
ncbi:MAG: AGE family epimerase/isomerase [Planctomycetota bacterium]